MRLRSLTKHVRDQNWFAVETRQILQGCVVGTALLYGGASPSI